MSKKLVREYYSGQRTQEWRRLARNPYHRLELDTTLHFMRKYLPKNGLILDAGGGPGRYTIELAKSGYDAVLFDITPELLASAKRHIRKEGLEHKVKGIIEGSIDDLSVFETDSFDAVVCLGGALSHIVNKQQREKAIHELARVAKRNSPIFISVIGRFALLTSALVRFPEEIESKNVYRNIRDTGDYHGGRGFAPCHFYVPEELKDLLKKRRLKILETAGLEGLASGHPRETNRLFRNRPKAWKIWWETHLRTCTHPSVVSISEHFMIICRKS